MKKSNKFLVFTLTLCLLAILYLASFGAAVKTAAPTTGHIPYSDEGTRNELYLRRFEKMLGRVENA